jgi:hypothetical protein
VTAPSSGGYTYARRADETKAKLLQVVKGYSACPRRIAAAVTATTLTVVHRLTEACERFSLRNDVDSTLYLQNQRLPGEHGRKRSVHLFMAVYFLPVAGSRQAFSAGERF